MKKTIHSFELTRRELPTRGAPVLLFALAVAGSALAAPLTSVEYHITGVSLQVSPAAVSVPKGIPGSVLVSIVSGDSTNNPASAQLSAGAYVEAILRGPSFPEPRRLVGAANGPLLLPAINLVGDYQLDNIRLVDAATGQTRMEGAPSSVPVHVFDQVLISGVTSRPLTLAEIQQKGIAIDDSNFRAVEFNVSFVLDGKTIPVKFPVVAPQFSDSTELIPAAEVEARLKQAADINQKIASEIISLPPDFETANLPIQIQGINFQVADPGAPQSLALTIPPIPALMVIPGNIGFLHQFFSVKIFTENGAPIGSGLSVDNVRAQLQLPPGPDEIVSTNYEQPGDDPLRFARIGPNKIIQPIQNVVQPGPDGELGTADDISRLQPAQTGQAEFLVEGLQEGLQVMNLDLTADLYGLAAGVVPVKGKAAGSVLVRNPRFSIAFSHPRTVRVGEPYTASITILNTGITPANLVQVTLNKNSLSGAVLNSSQPETIQLGTILPGQTATATYRLIAQRTGEITFSDLTTGDDSVTGRFRFRMGVDAQGVPLSPDTIAMPDYVNYLPADLVAAANRVLGQALSIATAAQLPPGIQRVESSIITRRVLDLAEAGQRVRYGEPLNRVLPDLLRDWQGGRVTNDGFDALLRTSDAGAEWRSVLFANMERADNRDGTQRLLNRAPDLAGLGQQFVLASAGPGQLRMDFSGGTNNATLDGSTQPYALVYGGTNGEWAVTPYLSNVVFTWTFTNAPPLADMAVLLVGTNGQAQRLRWLVTNPPVDAVYQFALSDPAQQLQVDLAGDGSIDQRINPSSATVNELPPTLVAVEQDLTVVAGRPSNPCLGPTFGNYGTVVAVVFSKPISQASVGSTNSYSVEGGNGANSVQVQPNGRVALLNLRKGVSAIRPRKILTTGATDVRFNPLIVGPTPIHSVYPGTTLPFTGGVAVRGRVLRGDGSPAAGIPVTLTMYDEVHGAFDCEPWVRRVSQAITDAAGNFDFDFVMSGIPYSVSATDTSGLSSNALQLIMESTIAAQADAKRLQEFISTSVNPESLLALFAAGSLPQAVAVVEGLDRALIRDVIPIGSGREGQEVPIALRFRGRATVTGSVVAADGITPVPNAAVNLFPDANSRELGRGVFADGVGQFTFVGVPLGVFSVQVETSDKRAATVIGIIDTPGQTMNLVIALPSVPMLFGTLRGQVFDSDNLTPVGNARIFLGKYDSGENRVSAVVRIVDADSSGTWEITNAPIQTLDVVGVTFDGSRKGLRLNVSPVANQVTYVNVTLQAATTVFGRVEFDDGRPATNALVAGGVALVRSDANGNFQLQGVPVGSASISAGLERNPAAGIDFPRLGTAHANIIAGAANYVVVKLRPAGRIFGKVFDAQGKPVPNVRVSIPRQGGFYWTDANTNGNYVFENLSLGDYTLSAPANAVAPQLNESELLTQVRTGNEDQILAAFTEAAIVFVGANDPLLTGEQLNFRPSKWGYTRTGIHFDGANVNADIRFIVQGTVSGKVLNAQGVPIGARVRLTGFGPDVTGEPVVAIRGEANSDPATGQFAFPNQLLAGPWGLQAASPFYPTVIQASGFTTEIDPDVSNVVLQFPPVREVNGRITGHVFNPDGSPAGQNVQVHISISSDYRILTDTNGFFDTQTAFPALGVGYTVEAFDPGSGLKGRAFIAMTPGITNVVDVHLLSRNSSIGVVVLRANGLPASGAQVQLDHGSYPNEAPLFAIADTNGIAIFNGLWEGNYAVCANYVEAATRLYARGGTSVAANETKSLTLHLGATGTVLGTFVKQDLTTPVYGAQVTIGNLGFAATDTNGFFRFDGVPIGAYQISSSDPVTGANAVTTTTLSFNGQTQTVQLVEATLGTVNGFVQDSYSTGFVPGASVQINFSDGLAPSRTVTTGPDGGFSFPGSPMGAFTLNASYRLPDTVNTTVSGQASGALTMISNNVTVTIQLQPLTYLSVRVVRSDGTTPAQNARVTLTGAGVNAQQDTSTNGIVQFNNLFVPASYTVTAISQIGAELHSGTQMSVTLGRGTNSTVILMLPGVGNVAGTVVASDGSTPVNNAAITLQIQAPLFSGQTLTALSDAQGRFAFGDVPLGPFLVTAASQSLAASANGTITAAGQTNQVSLQLGPSGSLLGRIVRADGVTPVAGVDVAIDYMSESVNAGRAVFRTGADGRFRFDKIPISAVHVSAAGPSFGGIINFNTALTANGQVLDLGDVRFDEALPQVVQVMPADTTVEVPTTTFVELLFSEALDTNSIHANGIFIRGTNGTVTSTVTLLPDTNGVKRLVRITPTSPLMSNKSYEVIALSGDLPGPSGGTIGSGPRDLVGRAMAAPFVSHFTTADGDPPILLSIFPSNNAVQIDPSAVPRLAFNETLRATGFVFTVRGPGGIVAGSASVGVNGQVLSFVPTAFLQPNATYLMTISNVFDLAGNRAAGEPFTTTFATLDTIGPSISKLRIASNAPPVGGATVTIEAVLASDETNASVRFTQNFNPVGTATNDPFQVTATLPPTGSTTIRAIATDQYGNDGPFAELVIAVQIPRPPTVHFALVSPTNSPIPTGSPIVVDVTASGDTPITNLTAVAGGAAIGNLLTTNGSQLRVQGTVSTNASPDQRVQVFAEATDSLGLTSGQQVFNLPISDATRPTLAIVSPTNNAHLAAGPSFNLAVRASDNSTNVALSLAVTGSLTFTQSLALTFAPNTPTTNVFVVPLTGAPTNGGPISATITATDAASNTTSAARTFWLPNTIGPAIATLGIGSNLPPLAGFTVPIEAILATNDVGITVRFTQDGNFIGLATNLPYRVFATLPASGSTTIRAIATDQYDNDGLVAQLIITVQTNVQPSIQFVRVSPAAGPVASGSSFSVNILASGNSGQFNISATLSGAVTGSANTTGTNLLVQGFVPAATIAGDHVDITAQAVDSIGQSTGPQLLRLPISDGTPPTLAILSPAQNAQLTPGGSLAVTTLVSDNSSNVTLQLAISGYISATQTQSVALSPNSPVTNVITIPLPGAPTNGSPLVATLTAIDGAANVASTARVFWLPGSETTYTWNRQALGQTFTCTNNGSQYSWPNNNNWSQSQVLGNPCGTGQLVPIAPSNWSKTNYPNGTNLDVILGGLGGAPANLDVFVSLHSLTVQADGGLNMPSPGAGSFLSAVNFFFTGDGNITRSSCCGATTLQLDGGTMEKTAGTNVFEMDPGIILNSFGGTLAVDSGTLALPGNSSYYTNGSFNVVSNATLVLVPGGHNVSFAGTFTGSGQGAALLNAGTLNAASGGLTFNVPEPVFQWTGGTISGVNPLTNAGAIRLSGTGGMLLAGTMNNAGLFRHLGSGDLGLNSPGIGAHFENLASGVYWLESDAGISVVSCCGPTVFDNYGWLRKSGGAGNSIISVTFNNLGGTVSVETGRLTLANSGSSSGGNFNVSAGATLDITGGGQPTWAGQMNGTGAGTLLLASGKLVAVPATLNFADGLFQWAGGTLRGPVTNVNVLSVSGTNASALEQTLYNANLIRHIGTGSLNFNSPAAGALLWNLPGAIYQFENDSGLYVSSCCGPTVFENQGLLRKIGGTNESRIDGVVLMNPGGAIAVEIGRLTLANNGSSSNGTFTVGAGAALDLTGGRSPTWAGLITGAGAGRVELNSGTLNASPTLTLDCTPGLFQWTGGALNGSVVNSNTLAISGANDVLLAGAFANAGLLRHSGAGSLALSSPAAGTRFQNLVGGTYRLETGGGIYVSSCCGPVNFDNFGTFTKNVSSSNAIISAAFNNLGGLVSVETGTLTLANNGSSLNGAFAVSTGATLDVTGGQAPTWAGGMTGRGIGAVVLGSGTLKAEPSVTLDFTNGLFQWIGATLAGTASNINVLMLSSANDHFLAGRLDNLGLVRHAGSGRLGLNSPAAGTLFRNLPGAIYQFETDSAIFVNSCCGPTAFENDGLLRKIGGAGTTTISVPLNNLGGTIEVNAGRLLLANNGSSANGTFNIAAGAALDLTGGAQPTWAGRLAGAGAGHIELNSGQINASGLTLDCAPGVFQWNGGTFNGTVTNLNELRVSGGLVSGSFFNAGTVRHTALAGLGLNSPGAGTTFRNLAGATYEFEGDGSIFVNSCCGPTLFENAGLVRKSGGLTNATISTPFSNQNGSIEVDSGTLSLGSSSFAQGSGAFTVQLGGTNAGQSGKLIAGNVSLGGPLHVRLATGFVPQVGAQFRILSCSSLSGTFSSLDVPAGISVSYDSTGVSVVVISQPPKPGPIAGSITIRSITRNAGQSILSCEAPGGENFVVEKSSDLMRWQEHAAVIEQITPGVFRVAVTDGRSNAAFFRLRLAQPP